jgi:uncharacterized membrane protein YozB (DUF420 family)
MTYTAQVTLISPFGGEKLYFPIKKDKNAHLALLLTMETIVIIHFVLVRCYLLNFNLVRAIIFADVIKTKQHYLSVLRSHNILMRFRIRLRAVK